VHLTRVITSVIGLTILIAIIGWGNLLIFWLLVSSAIVIGLLEYYHLAEAHQWPVYKLPGVLLGVLLAVVPFVFSLLLEENLPFAQLTEFTLTLIVLALFLYALGTKRPLPEIFTALSITLFGIFYVSWLLSHLTFLFALTNGKRFVFYVLVVVWAGDTGAYYTGRFFGRHQLAPNISPKKTVEGAAGGLLASLIGSCVAKLTFLSLLSYVDCVVLGLLLGVLEQVGDLCESMLKRSVDVKDSGTLLPGHGGILDRLDGVMFAAPVLYYYAILFLGA
jgi:phosphatidate cytidylyltransferase